jgi:hypothetical protein
LPAHGASNSAISLDLQQAALTLICAARDVTVFAFDFAGTGNDPLQRCLRYIFAGLKHSAFAPGTHTGLGKARLDWACRRCDFDGVLTRGSALLSPSPVARVLTRRPGEDDSNRLANPFQSSGDIDSVVRQVAVVALFETKPKHARCPSKEMTAFGHRAGL